MTADGSLAAQGIELAERLGHRFAKPELLAEALTHPSAVRRHGRDKGTARAGDYNRLEFLGDRVLGLIVARMLHERYADADAGELARRFNALVRQESLASVAEKIELGRFLKLSKSERQAGGGAKPAILADVCEAVIAALFLDGGLKAAEKFVRSHFEPYLDAKASPAKDAKTVLQEWAAARGLEPPVYSVSAREGPAHAPTFTVTVALPKQGVATGTGRAKRTAEQAAARALLRTLAHDTA
jgi:ribonuclease-3